MKPAPPGGTAPAGGNAPTVSPDSCWRVQIGTRPDRARADQLAEAARSLLLLPVGVEHEAKLSKGRTPDCSPPAAAEELRRRAAASGFPGAFRFRKKP